MSDDLLYEVAADGVMLVTLNRPERMNALSVPLREGLLEAIDEANRRDDVKALVITGAGRAFCAGADVVTHERDVGGEQVRPRFERMDPLTYSGRIVLAMRECEVPVLAAVNGAAAGAGLGIALACDVRFAAESARLGTVFIKRGLSTDYGVAYWLPRVVGTARAFELIYDGNVIDASRALEIGLVNRVYPDDRLLDETLAFARQIAAGPPLAYTSVRRLLIQATDTGMRNFLEQEWSYQSRLRVSRDSAEGFASFLEKREPVFRGE